jgi:hypothetical protein
MQLYEDHRSPKAVAVLCGNKKDLAPYFIKYLEILINQKLTMY